MRDANIGSQILKPPNSESDFHPLPIPHKLARQFLSSWTQTFLAKEFFKTRLFLSLWCGSDIPPPHKHTCVHASIHTQWKNVQEAKTSGADWGQKDLIFTLCHFGFFLFEYLFIWLHRILAMVPGSLVVLCGI